MGKKDIIMKEKKQYRKIRRRERRNYGRKEKAKRGTNREGQKSTEIFCVGGRQMT